MLYKLNKIANSLTDFPEIFWKIKPLWSGFRSIFALPRNSHLSPECSIPFLFIVGSGRSGNTLLRRLLMENRDIYIPPETYVLARVAEYRILGRSLGWSSFVDLVVSAFEYHSEFETFSLSDVRGFALHAKKWEASRQTLPNLIRELYRWMATSAGMESLWVGDKTPLNTLHLGCIDSVVPDAKYIYLLRDGVDVAASYRSANIYNSLANSAKRWLQSHKNWVAFRKKLNPNDFIEIRYEELVSSPDKILKEIASKFSMPRRREKLDIVSSLGDVSARKHHANVINPPNIVSIGKGRRSLSDDEISELKPILNTALKALGYDEI